MLNYEFIIALTALCISLWTIFSTRIHNRLSVRPYIDIVQTQNPDKDIIYCELVNNGIGPAIIQKPTLIKYNGKKYENLNNIFYEVDRNIWVNDIDWNKDLHMTTDEETNFTIPVNGKVPLYQIHIKNNDAYKVIRNILFRIKIEQEYKDIYNKKYTTSFS